MNTQSETETPADRESRVAHANGEMALGFAILGCLMAGGVGIWTAAGMTSGLGVFLCLLGAVTAFGTVFYIFLSRR